MTIPDPERLEQELIRLGRVPEPWVRALLPTLPASYLSEFPADEIAAHLAMMVGLSNDRPVAIQARAAGAAEWRLDVVGFDTFQFLAVLSNLLTVRGLAIIKGRVFTSRPAAMPPETGARPRRPGAPPRKSARSGPDRRPRIVDVFHVRRADNGTEAPDWDDLRSELLTLTRQLRDGESDEVGRRAIGRFVRALEPTPADSPADPPLTVSVVPASDGDLTEVRMAAADRPGFLYVLAHALALCGVRIEQAEIGTRAGCVVDRLLVTDRWGKPLNEAAEQRQLRLSLILIEHFTSRLAQATDPEAALIHFGRFANETMASDDWAEEFTTLDNPDVLDRLVRVLGESHFLWEEYLHAEPATFVPMIGRAGEIERRRGPDELARALEADLSALATTHERIDAFRRFKDREIFRADVRSILGMSGAEDGLADELSDLAGVLLDAALALAAEHEGRPSPRRGDGRPVPFALFALGKLGGRELGFASDLELMLVHDDREAPLGTGGRGAGEVFDGLVTALRAVFGTRPGRTFDLDFRLRPYGRAGSPATALSTFREYYRAGGDAWGYERQALVKLRAITGDPGLRGEVESLRDAFVYGPEPFDREGAQRLRQRQIAQHVVPGTTNAKYSPGALVDIEYFVQTLQIAHGAGDTRLRSPGTLSALRALAETGRLGRDVAASLETSYRAFRSLIDALRVVRGHARDLTLPEPKSPAFARLARRLSRPGAAELEAEIRERLESTRRLVATLPDFLPARGQAAD